MSADNLPELGNLLFGNYSGGHQIPRGGGFGEHLERLYDAAYAVYENAPQGVKVEDIGPTDSYSHFENDTFAFHAYWWGDCDCGLEDLTNAIDAAIKHAPECFTNRYHEAERKARYRYKGSSLENQMIRWADANGGAVRDNSGRPLIVSTAYKCDCDVNERRAAEWTRRHPDHSGEHAPTCGTVRPNFLYKPTGLRIDWYKYPFRDSYSSAPLTADEFGRVIDACIASLRAPQATQEARQ
jgi:hypothetical protein